MKSQRKLPEVTRVQNPTGFRQRALVARIVRMGVSSLVGAIARTILPPPARAAVKRAAFGRFERIGQDCGGMLTHDVYASLYDHVATAPEGDVVEVGGASGAGSITMALALIESGKRGNVITVEKMTGGSRDAFGSYDDNLARFAQNVATWSVTDRVRLFPNWLSYENSSEVIALLDTGRVGALMCDADGMLHRDFEIFWPLLAPEGVIIIDDYHERHSPKHALTYALLNQLEEWKLFERTHQIGDTVFGRKPDGGNISALDRAHCDAIAEAVERDFEAQRL